MITNINRVKWPNPLTREHTCDTHSHTSVMTIRPTESSHPSPLWTAGSSLHISRNRSCKYGSHTDKADRCNIDLCPAQCLLLQFINKLLLENCPSRMTVKSKVVLKNIFLLKCY
jgi:hypothetical protein